MSDICVQKCIANLFTIVNNRNSVQVHLTSEWINRFWIHPNRIPNSDFLLHYWCKIQNRMHSAEQKKPDIKGYVHIIWTSHMRPWKRQDYRDRNQMGLPRAGDRKQGWGKTKLCVTITVSYFTLGGNYNTTRLPKLIGFQLKIWVLLYVCYTPNLQCIRKQSWVKNIH